MIPFLWTNDDISCGQYDDMARQLDFLTKYDLKGTFFVVPIRGGDRHLTNDPKLVELLKQAMADGHEVHQHSVTHKCIENGTADLRMFDLMGEAVKIDYSQNRFVYERMWQVDALEAHIGWGRAEWIDAFGVPSAGYRPGCGSFCANMYTAVANLGFKWTSSRLVSMTGWRWSAGQYDYPLRLEGPKCPYREGALVEIPILDDVAFKVPREKVEDFADLGWRLWEACVEAKVPYNLVCHPQYLAFNKGTGYAVHEKLLPRVLASGRAQAMTMHVYYQQLQANMWPMARDEDRYPGPNDLPEWHALARRNMVTEA
ncbi:polysaccharide deacetylase family protein [Phycisphaerales bacterium AB-hyl4]|uniref:Polysaccharide deacetylase family protein n=1 Tax=Natronomicrosphaera hydrolytica TaxID=3242702 RepID=A0ABV4U719_9BACT